MCLRCDPPDGLIYVLFFGYSHEVEIRHRPALNGHFTTETLKHSEYIFFFRPRAVRSLQSNAHIRLSVLSHCEPHVGNMAPKLEMKILFRGIAYSRIQNRI